VAHRRVAPTTINWMAGDRAPKHSELASLLILVLVVALSACGGSAKPGVTNSAASNASQFRQQWATALADQTAFRACPPQTSSDVTKGLPCEAKESLKLGVSWTFLSLAALRCEASGRCVRELRAVEKTADHGSSIALGFAADPIGARAAILRASAAVTLAVRELAPCIKAAA
jgi:hypothetical protein